LELPHGRQAVTNAVGRDLVGGGLLLPTRSSSQASPVTGLAITVLCIVTLFVVMQITGRVNWQTVFRDNGTSDDGATSPGSIPAEA